MGARSYHCPLFSAFAGDPQSNIMVNGESEADMWQLYLGVILFAGPHLFSSIFPHARDRLREKVGANPYKLIYSAVTLASVALFVLAYRVGGAVMEPLYAPWHGARHVVMLLILLAFILIFSNGSLGHIRRGVRHPFSLGIMLWSFSHLLMNGERMVVVMFGTFFVVALVDVIFSLARGKGPSAFVPNWKHDARGIAVGIVLYLVFAFGFHPYILGVAVAG
jgi:uncharacterized membrane protein